MTAFIALALLLGAVAFAVLTRGAWWKGSVKTSADEQVVALGRQMDQLKALHAAGTLTEEQFAQASTKVQARIAEYGGSVPEKPIAAQGPSSMLMAGVAALFIVVTAGGYALYGSPQSVAVAPGMASNAGGAGNGGHNITREQIEGMIDKLAQRLKDKPDDAVGWGMLARSYAAIGRQADALATYKKALEMRPADADLLADYADALAVAQNRSLDGEPATLIERALKADPDHVKALALAGTIAYNRKDYPLAVQHWERAVKNAPPDNPFIEDLRNGVNEARQLAGMAPAASSPAVAAVAAPAPAPVAADGKASVSGTVTIASGLAGKVDPQDTVFVFARPADGSRMPLAILKKQAKDLPLAFVLDDSLAMSPAAKISTAGKVLVSARVSKSGNAMPQPGDLQGAVGPIAVGSENVKIEIGEVVAK